MSARAQLLELFRAGVDAVHAGRAVEASLRRRDPGAGSWTVLGAGKAACAMAQGAAAALGGRLARGVVVTKQGHGLPVAGFEVREAAHPVPDQRAEAAASEALALARSPGPGARLLVLLSGGASALWSAPAPGVTLEDKRALTQLLLRTGVEIGGLNAVRKHLSAIKGGLLARAATPRPMLTLAVSDVAGDAPDVIGSGPTAPDPTTYADALRVVELAAVRERIPGPVLRHLRAGAAGERAETPKPGDGVFRRCEYRVIASLDDALDAVVEAARRAGLRVKSLGRALSGEAVRCASRLAAELGRARAQGIELLVVGGEPTVTVRGDGRGGRAQELALAFALEVGEQPGMCALFAGTDGTDGPTDAAGGVVDSGTLARARALGLEARALLERNDSYSFLKATGDLLVTGPTHTNVSDLGIIRVPASSGA